MVRTKALCFQSPWWSFGGLNSARGGEPSPFNSWLDYLLEGGQVQRLEVFQGLAKGDKLSRLV